MPKKLGLSEVISRLKSKYGNNYDYSNIDYKKIRDYITIVDSYNIEVWEDNEWLEEEKYEVSKSYVVELLQRILNIENESNVDTLIEMFNDEYDDPPFVFRKFEYVDIN